jgi:hypothetical protein
MSALARHGRPPFRVPDWQPDVLQLMDEQHLAAWSDSAQRRLLFASSFGQFLSIQRDTELCVLYGQSIVDLDSFCAQLERALPGPGLDRRIDGARGVVSLLRARTGAAFKRPAKFRYYLWHDADVLLARDRGLFGRLIDAIAGVAAEAEYVSDDLLLIHRAVLVGSGLLAAYAQQPAGQFCSWYDDGLGEPFWRVVTGVPAPSVLAYEIDPLMT